MQLLVVGAGEMGRWFARRSGAEEVAFADRDREAALEAAAALENGRAVALDATDSFDVVCLAVPMSEIPDAIAKHAGKATEAVVDVSGEMADSVEALQSHAPERERASFHPLFSASNAPGSIPTVVVKSGPTIDRICEALIFAGNDLFETTVSAHDEAMETVQARAHTAVLAYALAAEDVDPRFHTSLSEPLAELVEQITENAPEVYAEIQSRFDGSDSVAEAATELASADEESFVELFEEAGK